jgi:hypothetical protein
MENADDLWERSLLNSAIEVSDDVAPPYALNTRSMNANDISNFIDMTARMHECNVNDITYSYEPIIGDDGQVHLDELNLIFRMCALDDDSTVSTRVIHTIRVTVPRETQQRAQKMRDSIKKDSI